MAAKKPPGWWDGNSTRMWRTLVLMYLSLITALGTWGMLRVVEIPAKYPTKTELQCMVDRLERTMSTGFAGQGQKIDDLNKYLRERR